MNFTLRAHLIGTLLLAAVCFPCTAILYPPYILLQGLGLVTCAIAALALGLLPFSYLYYLFTRRFVPANHAFLSHLILGVAAGIAFGYLNFYLLRTAYVNDIIWMYLAFIHLHVQPITNHFHAPWDILSLCIILLLPYTLGHYLASKSK